jgi:hypothetical protein
MRGPGGIRKTSAAYSMLGMAIVIYNLFAICEEIPHFVFDMRLNRAIHCCPFLIARAA